MTSCHSLCGLTGVLYILGAMYVLSWAFQKASSFSKNSSGVSAEPQACSCRGCMGVIGVTAKVRVPKFWMLGRVQSHIKMCICTLGSKILPMQKCCWAFTARRKQDDPGCSCHCLDQYLERPPKYYVSKASPSSEHCLSYLVAVGSASGALSKS